MKSFQNSVYDIRQGSNTFLCVVPIVLVPLAMLKISFPHFILVTKDRRYVYIIYLFTDLFVYDIDRLIYFCVWKILLKQYFRVLTFSLWD